MKYHLEKSQGRGHRDTRTSSRPVHAIRTDTMRCIEGVVRGGGGWWHKRGQDGSASPPVSSIITRLAAPFADSAATSASHVQSSVEVSGCNQCAAEQTQDNKLAKLERWFKMPTRTRHVMSNQRTQNISLNLLKIWSLGFGGHATCAPLDSPYRTQECKNPCWHWPLTFWMSFRNLVEHFSVKFGDACCIGFWDIVYKSRQTAVQTVSPWHQSRSVMIVPVYKRQRTKATDSDVTGEVN